MSYNMHGRQFRFMTCGESHGSAIGCIVDGMPANIALTEEDLQSWLERRRPGTSRYVTQRQEDDKVEILSGTFEGVTTGTPILLLIHNKDSRSKDYEEIREKFRPGHGDYAYWKKYGVRDYRGGGRASARETAMRVAVGGCARRVLDVYAKGVIKVRGLVVQIGKDRACVDEDYDWWGSSGGVGNMDNEFFAPNKEIVEVWRKSIEEVRRAGDSLGAMVEVRASNVPSGIGSPLYAKLDADIASAMMSINAVKGVEIGSGFGSVSSKGSVHNDVMRNVDGIGVRFLSNNNGGVLAGISTGQDIIVRVAFKPTSSIRHTQQTIDKQERNVDIETKGRHDPCVGIRGAPVAEAMLACVLADHVLARRMDNI